MTPQPGSPRPVRPRDVGRAAVYAGENQVARILDRSAEFPVVEVAGSRITLPPERHFGDLDAVQRYVDAVLALPWVVRRWPAAAAVPVAVRERRGATKAHYEVEQSRTAARSEQSGTATIAVPVRGADARWALRELVVLHEIAHHLASGARSRAASEQSGASPADYGHGPAFTSRMLELTAGVMGEEVAFLLRVAWMDQGVVIG